MRTIAALVAAHSLTGCCIAQRIIDVKGEVPAFAPLFGVNLALPRAHDGTPPDAQPYARFSGGPAFYFEGGRGMLVEGEAGVTLKAGNYCITPGVGATRLWATEGDDRHHDSYFVIVRAGGRMGMRHGGPPDFTPNLGFGAGATHEGVAWFAELDFIDIRF